MIRFEYILDRIKDVKLRDYLSVVPMMVAGLLIPFYRKKYRTIWLICEEPKEARDNGYHFFRYMCLYQPQQKCVYAIKRKSVDYEKVKKLGMVIEYGSIQHWLAYFLCEYNISSQKGGKPNAAICSFMELNNYFHTCNIFLQHGVIINNLRWLYSDRSKIDKFITSTVPETEYIIANFGYPKDCICLTGMPRFDALHRIQIVPNRILIMPTWRYWFNLKSKQNARTDIDFESSEYLRCWTDLLTNSEMNRLIREYRLEVIFYPHRNMQNHIRTFEHLETSVVIASWEKYDIQDLLKSSAMMITDYSSVFFDMVYMKKPIIFYQFDEDKYREYQYGEGYFNYHHNVFGNTYSSNEQVVRKIEEMAACGFKPSKDFLEEHERIFKYWDEDNSKRIFNMLLDARNENS